MKALLKIFFFITVISLIAGCERTDVLEIEDSSSSKKSITKTVTMGFNVVFTGNYIYQGPGSECGEFPPFVRIINTGEGSGSHFGKLTSYFDFCVDIRDSSYPNDHIVAYFQDENGDRLDIEVAGFVLDGRVPGIPNHAISYFKDPFKIIGGTGRFEGASGGGMTKDYNSSKDIYSHHHWKGSITLVKNK